MPTRAATTILKRALKSVCASALIHGVSGVRSLIDIANSSPLAGPDRHNFNRHARLLPACRKGKPLNRERRRKMSAHFHQHLPRYGTIAMVGRQAFLTGDRCHAGTAGSCWNRRFLPMRNHKPCVLFIRSDALSCLDDERSRQLPGRRLCR